MKTENTFTATIYIAGDVAKIKDACRWFCMRGLCVTVTPTDFVFTGGMESGAAIGLINYPRFPASFEKIREASKALASALLEECCQRSCTIVFSDKTVYIENPNVVVPR